jgi:glycosyltransferase involved in cell wall biosynthesis
VKIRWVTWWPAPYWIGRFEALAARPDVDLEVIFLAGSSARQDWRVDESSWAFRSQVLDRRPSRSGYYGPTLRIGPVGRLLRDGRRTALVMPYADLTYGVAALIGRLMGIPYHLFVANTVDDARSGRRFNELAKRILLGGARSCLATGALQADYARHYVRRQTPIGIIGNPVDTVAIRRRLGSQTEDREALRRERGWTNRFVIAYVGRLSAEKNLPILVEAADRLADGGIPVSVAFAGSGPLEGDLRRLGNTARARLDLLGFVDGDRLARVYAAADAFVLASASESWGLVVNEAMEYALPVIVSDRVGARQLIDPDRSGFITPVGDANALAAILERLASEPELRSRIGAAGRRAVAGQTVEHWVEAVVRHFHALG